VCLRMCPRIPTEGRKSLRLKEAPVGIEPTNRGFAVRPLATPPTAGKEEKGPSTPTPPHELPHSL
jgi:hypothetical protein